MKITQTITCFLLLGYSAIYAQQIPLTMSLARNVSQPVTFEVPGENKTILLFYAFRFNKGQFYATEVDNSLTTLRTSNIQEVKTATTDETIKMIGGFHPEGSDRYLLFIRLGNAQIWEIALDRQSFALTAVRRMYKPKNANTIGGIAEGNHYYLLFSRKEKKKKEGEIIVLETGDGMQFDEHIIAASTRLDIFDKRYSPIFPSKDIEQDPEIVAHERDKVFAAAGKIYFVSDVSEDIYGSPTGRTRVTTIDLKTFTLDFDLFTCFEFQETERNWVCSYLYDSKLFQMGLKKDYFSLEIFDLADKKKVFSTILLEKDSLNQLLNSDVIVPGRGSLGIERTYQTPDKFSQKLLQLTPFMQVRKSGEDYLIGMGGHLEVNNPPSNNAFSPAGGIGMTSGYSYERTTFFYAVLHATDYSHSKRFIAHGIQNQIKTITENEFNWITESLSPGVFRLFNQYYMGKYSRKKDAYIFTKLRPE